MPSDFVKTREIPEEWYSKVEKSRDKSRKLIKQVVAVDQTTSIVIGKLESVEMDRLWHLKYPYCRLTMAKPIRFRTDGKKEFKMGDQELFFINKPEMIMDIQELSKKFPRVYDEIHGEIKKGAW